MTPNNGVSFFTRSVEATQIVCVPVDIQCPLAYSPNVDLSTGL
jgi:hypothetical protein